jgi:predicted nucleic acid-binding protein
MRSAAAAGIAGGTLYDYLIAQCALKARADAIYTWNTRHYQLFGPAVLNRLRLPEAAT